MIEVFRAAATEWSRQLPITGALLLGTVGLLAVERFGRRSRITQRVAFPVGLIAAVVVGLVLAWKSLWLGDDAFISFRYAQNFAAGRGLVFNPGEWVEGYTNFLWTFVLGLAASLGGELPYVALFGNLASFVGALVLTAVLVRRSSPTAPALPFSSFALAGSYAFTTWATSGLETMPVACLVVAGAVASTARRGPLLSGLLLTAAAMARPDQVLLYGAMGVALVVEDLSTNDERRLLGRLRLPRYVSYATPFLLFFVPWFLWRWTIYGDFYPNTYYAKSGGEAYYSQGWIYAAQFIASTGGWFWLPALLFTFIARPKSRNELRLRVFTGLSFILFTHYVIRVGGDFMQHRFFIPLLPIVFATTEVGIRWRTSPDEGRSALRKLACTLGAAALVASLVPLKLIPDFRLRWMIAAEHTYYRVTSLFPLEIASALWKEGHQLQQVFTTRGLKPRFAIECVGMVAYLSDLPLVDVLGLTNKRIAHKPIQRRGRPGHEKWASLEEILAEGAVVGWRTYDSEDFHPLSRAVVDGVEFHFLRYDPELIEAFSGTPGSILPNPHRDIANIVESAEREFVEEAMAFYDRFLERHPEKEALLAKLAMRLNTVESFEGQLAATAILEGTGLTVREVTPLSGDWLPAGARGKKWLASLPDVGSGVGRFVLPLGTIQRRELRFALGGSDSARLAVELEVDGTIVLRTQPHGERGLRPINWDLSAFQGKRATLIVRDDDPREGVGLRADTFHWSAKEGEDLKDRLERIAAGDVPGTVEGWTAASAQLREARSMLQGPALEGSHLHWPLDEGWPEGTEAEGTAFGQGPATGPLHLQGAVYRYVGAGFLSSYHGEDAATGKLLFPEIVLPKGGIHLLVAGGKNCLETFVGIQVGDRIIARACGKDDEVFRPVVLDPRGHVGKKGRIVVSDSATGRWGHILVDEVVIAPERAPAPKPLELRTAAAKTKETSE